MNPDQQAHGLALMKTFQEWFEKHVISPAVDGCSEVLLLLPWTNGAPDYRNKYRESEQ